MMDDWGEDKWEERCSFFEYEAANGNWYTQDGRVLDIHNMNRFHLNAIANVIRDGRAEDRARCLPYIEAELKKRNGFRKHWKKRDMVEKAKARVAKMKENSERKEL